VDPGTIDHSSALDDTSQYLTKMDSAVNALGSAAGSQGSQIEVGQIKQQAGNVIKRLADIREEKENTAEERERIKRNIQTMGGADMQWKTQVLQTIAITLAVVLVTYFALGFVLSPTVNMSIAIVVLLVGVGVAIYFAVIKE
jgi:hypothetical protein